MEMSFRLTREDILLAHDDESGYDRVHVPGMESLRAEEGAPELPAWRRTVLLPPDMRVAEVRVVSVGRFSLPGEFVPVPTDSDGDREPDPLYYGEDGLPFPPTPEVVEANDAYRGLRLTRFAVTPFEWEPATRTLFAYESVDISLLLEPVPSDERAPVRRRPGRRYSRELLEFDWVRDHVVNPEDLSLYPREHEGDPGPIDQDRRVSSVVDEDTRSTGFRPTDRPSLEGPAVDMVIVTNDTWIDGTPAGDLVETFQELADWRTMTGTPTVVRTVAWVRENYAGRDDPERIRAFLEDAYSLWGTDYLLIGGDTEVVLPRMLGSAPGLATSSVDTPTAWYWAEFDGTWTRMEDAHGYFVLDTDYPIKGEVGVYPELWVGRIPARTEEEAGAMLEKIYVFERRPGYETTVPPASFYSHAILAAGFTNHAEWSPTGLAAETYQNGIFLADRIRSQVLGPSGFTTRTFYPSLPGSKTCGGQQLSCYSETKAGAGYVGSAPPERVFTASNLREGLTGDDPEGPAGVVFHIEHSHVHAYGPPYIGSDIAGLRPPTTVCEGISNCTDCPTWRSTCFASYQTVNSPNPALDRSLVSTLDNGPSYFLGLSQGSETGAYNLDCVAEALVRDPDGGAVAFCGKTLSAGAFGDSDESETSIAFFDQLINERKPIGVALAETGSAPSVFMATRWHLFGDPTLRAWTTAPGDLDVSATPDALQNAGFYDITVLVEEASTPVAGARVCLSRGNDVYALGTTAANGEVRFPAILIADPQDDIAVWAVEKDHQAAMGTILGANSTGLGIAGKLVYAGHAWTEAVENGTQSDYAEAGDVLELEVTLANEFTPSAVPSGQARLFPTPRVKGFVTIDGTQQPDYVWIGRSEGHPPALADTFDLSVNEFGIRPELEPTAETGLVIWRDLDGDYHVEVAPGSLFVDDSFDGVFIADGGVTIVDDSGLDAGDTVTLSSGPVADVLSFHVVGGPGNNEFVFRASAEDWVAIDDPTEGYGIVPINGSTTCTYEVELLPAIPAHTRLNFTIAARLADAAPAPNFSDFYLNLRAPRLELVSYRLEELPSSGCTGCESSTTYELVPLVRNSGDADAATVEVRATISGSNVIQCTSVAELSVARSAAATPATGIIFCDQGETAEITSLSLWSEVDGNWTEWVDIENLDPWVYPMAEPKSPRIEPWLDGIQLTWLPPVGNIQHQGYHVYVDSASVVRRATDAKIAYMPYWRALGLAELDATGDPIAYRFGVSLVRTDLRESDIVWFGGQYVHQMREAPGWPVVLPGRAGTSVVLVDIDGDDELEIVAAGEGLTAWNADGTSATGDPDGVLFDPVPSTSLSGSPELRFLGEIAAGNIDDDAYIEIVGVYGTGTLYVVDGVNPARSTPVSSRSTPVLANIGGDSKLEILVSAYNDENAKGGIYAYKISSEGKLASYRCDDPVLVEFPTELDLQYNLAGLAAVDLDDDSYAEIIQTRRDGQVFVWNGDTTPCGQNPTYLWAGTPSTDSTPRYGDLSTPVVTDGDCDEVPELFIGTTHPARMHVLNALTGVRDYGLSDNWWSSVSGSDVPYYDGAQPPAVADFGDTDRAEIVTGRRLVEGTDEVDPMNRATLFWLDGSTATVETMADSAVVPHRRLAKTPATRWSPVIGDIDDDGVEEVILAADHGVLFAWEITWDEEEDEFASRADARFPLVLGEKAYPPALGDVDDDGLLELVVPSDDGMVHLFDLMGTTAEWPMGGANAQRTGFLVADCPDPRPGPPEFAGVELAVLGLPGSGSRSILLQVSADGEVTLELFDVQGRRIVRLFDEVLSEGVHEVPWDGQNEAGGRVEAGVYFLRATIGATTTTTRFVVVR